MATALSDIPRSMPIGCGIYLCREIINGCQARVNTIRQLSQSRYFSIVCLDEPSSPELSNNHPEEIWSALEILVLALMSGGEGGTTDNTSIAALFAWKGPAGRRVSAREAYAWRGVIDEIKSADLNEVASKIKISPDSSVLLRDRPAMLKIAGEVANALFHSYTAKHSVAFHRRE